MRIIIAMTGASGAIYGIGLLEALSGLKVETYLVLSNWGKKTIELETGFSVQQVISLATAYVDRWGEETVKHSCASQLRSGQPAGMVCEK